MRFLFLYLTNPALWLIYHMIKELLIKKSSLVFIVGAKHNPVQFNNDSSKARWIKFDT